jgi:hypothetical protein
VALVVHQIAGIGCVRLDGPRVEQPHQRPGGDGQLGADPRIAFQVRLRQQRLEEAALAKRRPLEQQPQGGIALPLLRESESRQRCRLLRAQRLLAAADRDGPAKVPMELVQARPDVEQGHP